MTSHLHAQSAAVSIVKLGWLPTVVHMKQSLLVLMSNTLAGGDWSSSPTDAKFPDVHLNVNCAVNCPLPVFLVYLTANDTSLYWSRILPTARQVKWWSSSVVERVDPSPPIDKSSDRNLVLIAPLSGREQSCDAVRAESCNKTRMKKSVKILDFMTSPGRGEVTRKKNRLININSEPRPNQTCTSIFKHATQ